MSTQPNPQSATLSPEGAKHTTEKLTLRIGQDGGVFVRTESGRLIAGFQTATLNESIPEGEGEANASLFLAAPDLLDALKEVFAQMREQYVPSDTCNDEWCDTYRKVEAAIAKAEGQ